MLLCKKLKQLRIKKGLTIKALARLINVSQSTISSWEKGKSTPYLSKLIMIVKTFDVTCRYLLGV
ncbi:MAG: helix-turn-helix transcriptional regulator [Clostridia bacterium]|nr:helix-turn-helix transcriptional regulator [Clostridia bacterium]